jgi:hypothetical protein
LDYISLDVLQVGRIITLAALPFTDKKKAAHRVEELLRYALR